MKPVEQYDKIKIQTNYLPKDMAYPEYMQAAKAIALCYRNDEFIARNFFAAPPVGKVTYI